MHMDRQLVRRLGTLAVLGAALACLGKAAPASAESQEKGFESLFNGKDLSGWEGDSRFWSVEDGCIVGQTTEQTPAPHNTFLVYKGGPSKGVFGNFELHFKFKLRNHNSGMQYRSRELGDHVMTGYQADIAEGTPSKYTGILYEEKGRGILAQRGQKVSIAANGKKTVESLGDEKAIADAIHMDDWNDYVIIADGPHLVEKVNGKTTVDVTDHQAGKAAAEGLLGLQIHMGPPMKVQFKQIEIKQLSR